MAQRDEDVIRKLLGSASIDRILADPTDIPAVGDPGVLVRWPQTFVSDGTGGIPAGVEYGKIWTVGGWPGYLQNLQLLEARTDIDADGVNWTLQRTGQGIGVVLYVVTLTLSGPNAQGQSNLTAADALAEAILDTRFPEYTG